MRLVRRTAGSWLAMTVCAAALMGCSNEPPPKREAPPTAKAVACDATPKFNDPKNVASLPPKSGGFCLDPTGSDKAYGDGAKAGIRDICNLFDGECEIYLGLKVKRVVEARYVDGSGSGATIDLYLSTFESTSGAYAMFTKRVVGERDPAHPDTAKPIAGGGAAALGMGQAMLWRGPYLVEMTLNDSNASTKQMKTRGDALLPALIKQIGDKLTGETTLPAAAAALPSAKRIPLGIRLYARDLFKVSGVGGGAFGYYANNDKRWRVLSIAKEDGEQAKDALGSFGKLPGATKEKIGTHDVVRVMIKDAGAQSEWLLVQHNKSLFGIGDEPRVLRAGMSAEEHSSVSLTLAEKKANLAALIEAK